MVKKYSSIEQTFVMLKPDTIARGLVGKIFQRIEELGMKLVASRMIMASEAQIAKHYPVDSKEWSIGIGKKSLKGMDGDKKMFKKLYGTDSLEEVGKIIYENMKNYLTEGPIIISVWEGNHGIERMRKLIGYAVPTFSEIGTLRERYAFDTPVLALKSGRMAFKNLIHASDSVEEAKREIKLWFGDSFKDLSDYERVDYIDIF